MSATVDPFSTFGAGAKTKLLLLGSIDFRTEELMNRARSLQLEHVSPVGLTQRGISRAGGSAAGPNDLALMRRWFFARKPDAGFVLTDFPATLLQAQVFDQWLDARDEEITAAVAGTGAPAPVIEHYRTLGLLWEDPAST